MSAFFHLYRQVRVPRTVGGLPTAEEVLERIAKAMTSTGAEITLRDRESMTLEGLFRTGSWIWFSLQSPDHCWVAVHEHRDSVVVRYEVGLRGLWLNLGLTVLLHGADILYGSGLLAKALLGVFDLRLLLIALKCLASVHSSEYLIRQSAIDQFVVDP